MYSYKIEQAVKAASILHQDQLRKGGNIPYISHLMSVALILRDYTTDEDTLVASLLHDTVEDTDYSLEELREDFGKKVCEIVQAVTEPPYKKDGKKLSWIEVKKTYAKQLKKGPIEAVIIAAADKTHNFRCIVEDYYSDHDGFLRDFGTELDERLEAYQMISNTINNRLSDGIVHEFNQTFKAYKDFIYDVKESVS